MRPRSLLGFVGQLGPQSETPSQQEVNRGSWWEKSFVENGGQGERACDHGGHGPGGGILTIWEAASSQTVVTVLH